MKNKSPAEKECYKHWLLTSWPSDFTEESFKNLFLHAKYEQPSLKGAALVSYLYSEKDGWSHQPLVAGNAGNLANLFVEMLKTREGTEATVIYQTYSYVDSSIPLHNMAAKIIKTDKGLKIICSDSMNWTEDFRSIFDSSGNYRKSMEFYCPRISSGTAETGMVSRQIDKHSCILYSIKDSRELNRKIGDELVLKIYDPHEGGPRKYGQHLLLPPDFLKSMQSLSFFKRISELSAGAIVNRKNMTLMQVIGKHTQNNEEGTLQNKYTEHFSRKYCVQIKKYLDEVNDRQSVIRVVEKYDAGKITATELVARFRERLILENRVDILSAYDARRVSPEKKCCRIALFAAPVLAAAAVLIATRICQNNGPTL